MVVAFNKYPLVHFILHCAAHAGRRLPARGTVQATDQFTRKVFWLWGQWYMAILGNKFCHVLTSTTTKDDQVHQRVSAQSICAVNGDASYLASSIKTWERSPSGINDYASIHVGRNATHSIVRCRLY